MTIPKIVYPFESTLYTCELENCPYCKDPLKLRPFQQSNKIVQTLSETMHIIHQTKQCHNLACRGESVVFRSARWEQISPHNTGYGYDVIAQIGWYRQQEKQQYAQIHERLSSQIQISESSIRRLYNDGYLPMLACHERKAYPELEAVAQRTGLLLHMDGLAPEGGEAQLWYVGELQTGLVLRCGWLGKQNEDTFVNFLQPIDDLGLKVALVMSDKQRGLLPAVERVFPKANHAYCQAHYLKGLAEPIADKDREAKVELRKMIRKEIGEIVREEAVEAPGVLTVTGLIASPIETKTTAPVKANMDTVAEKIDISNVEAANKTKEAKIEIEKEVTPVISAKNEMLETSDAQDKADEIEKERQAVVQDIRRRVRFLLTLKGRPPFCLAGLEMYYGLQELVVILDKMLAHYPDATLMSIHKALVKGVARYSPDFALISQAEFWLRKIDTILDPDLNVPRGGDTVKQELNRFLEDIVVGEDEWLDSIQKHLSKKTKSYASGLFHTYDNPAVPRTNNEIESDFRDVQRRLLSTTGQKGLTKRLLHRYGAWELLPCPDTLLNLTHALSNTSYEEWKEERQRFEQHQQRFRMHTRSPKRAKKQLDKLVERWCSLE